MSNIKEIWRQVPGFSHCFVSNYGRVWNKRSRKGPNKGTVYNRGYAHIHWVNDHGEECLSQVHHIVALTWPDRIPNPGGKTQLDHLDGDSLNNAVWNLRWVTAKENCDNLVRMKRVKTPSVFRKRRISCEGYRIETEDGERCFRTMKAAAVHFRCSSVTLSRILAGTQKKNGYGIKSITRIYEQTERLFN